MNRGLRSFLPFVLVLMTALPLGASVEVKNEYLKILGDNESGRFFLRTTGGDPAIAADQDKLLLSEDVPPTSFASIRIDGYDYKFGDPDRGFFTVPMQVRNNSIICTWTINNIDVSQVLELGTGLLTGRQDGVKISYMVVNKDFREHSVGVRLCLDILLGKNDGAPFKIPGVGEITTETFLEGANVPSYWYTFDDLANPVIRAQGTLKADGLVSPDRLLFAGWARMDKNPWDFKIIEGRGFIRNVGTPDSAVAVYWNEKTLAPNSRLGVSTMYGLYGEMVLTGDPFRVILDGPTNAHGEAMILGAEISRLFGVPVEAASVTINLPEGLALKPGETAARDLGTLSTAATNRQTWIVVPENSVQGEMQWSVTVKGTVEKKEYRTTASRGLIVYPQTGLAIVDATVVTPPPAQETQKSVTVVTQRPVLKETSVQVFQRYSFDFSRIDGILAEIAADRAANDALIARLNEMLKARKKAYPKDLRDADISKSADLRKKNPGYLQRVATSSSNVIRVQNVTNVIQ